LPAPIGTVAPLGISIFLGLAMVGVTVAKRHDLIQAAEQLGILHRVLPEGEGPGGLPQILVDTSADHRRPHRRHRRFGLPLRRPDRAALRPR